MFICLFDDEVGDWFCWFDGDVEVYLGFIDIFRFYGVFDVLFMLLEGLIGILVYLVWVLVIFEDFFVDEF